MRRRYASRPGVITNSAVPRAYIFVAICPAKNMSLLPYRQSRPRLNPVENIWQFIRDIWLSNRIFTSYRYILDHCCFA
jgi:hypothetical protein